MRDRRMCWYEHNKTRQIRGSDFGVPGLAAGTEPYNVPWEGGRCTQLLGPMAPDDCKRKSRDEEASDVGG